jgi:hypothetical protein
VPAGPAFIGRIHLIVHAIRGGRLGCASACGSSGWNAGGLDRPEHAGKGLYQSRPGRGTPRFTGIALPSCRTLPPDERGRPVYLRDVAVLAVPAGDKKTIADASRILDLTDKVADDGKLRWDVPAGDWSILVSSARTTGS